jgi:hypothetical protein
MGGPTSPSELLPAPLFAQLQDLGAGEFEHLNGSLATHLHGTETLLRQWGARPALCRAGLYHAVYGTDGYQPALLGLAHRQRIQALLGEEAEALAYLYGAADRGRFYPRIGTPAQCLFSDRFTQADHEISLNQLADLCELVMANELEIASGSEAFRAQYGAALSELFERMQGLVSEAAFASYQAILPTSGDGAQR